MTAGANVGPRTHTLGRWAHTLVVGCGALLRGADGQPSQCPTQSLLTSASAGDPSQPVSLVLGCPYEVMFTAAGGESLYTVVDRGGSTGDRLEQMWDMDTSGSMYLYSFHNAVVQESTGSWNNLEWYWYPLAADGSTVWSGGDAFAQYAHRVDQYATWMWDDPSDSSLIYVTLTSTLASEGSRVFGGTVTFEVIEQMTYINPESIQSLQQLWETCCLPTYNPEFDRGHWFAENGADPDQVPACNWVPLDGMTPIIDEVSGGYVSPWGEGSLINNQSCEDLQHVHCDAAGNVIEVDLSNLGLHCEQLPDMDGLRHIKSFDVSNNRIAGSIPDVLRQSLDLETVEMSHNHLSGAIPCFDSALLEVVALDSNVLTGT